MGAIQAQDPGPGKAHPGKAQPRKGKPRKGNDNLFLKFGPSGRSAPQECVG